MGWILRVGVPKVPNIIITGVLNDINNVLLPMYYALFFWVQVIESFYYSRAFFIYLPNFSFSMRFLAFLNEIEQSYFL